MKKTLLSLIAGICISANSYAANYQDINKGINYEIKNKTNSISELCERLYQHKLDSHVGDLKAKNDPSAYNLPEPKQKYNEEQKKELESYIITKNYMDLSNPDLAKYGSISYLLAYENKETIITLAIVGTDRYAYKWNKYDHRYFMIHPFLEKPKLYEQNDMDVLGCILLGYNNKGNHIKNNELLFKVEDNGADGINEPNPITAVWLNEVKDFEQEYKQIGKYRIPTNFTTPSSDKDEIDEFNKVYLKLLSNIENNLKNSIEKLDK